MTRADRTFAASSFDADRLARAKGITTVSLCIPARNEETTVGPIVAAVRTRLVDQIGLVDEIVVVDDHSTDHTAEVAAAAGARVATTALGDGNGDSGGHVDADGSSTVSGKGAALWRSLHASTGDLVIWCDADIVGFDPQLVVGLIGPMLVDPGIGFVKGHYARPDDGIGGGRVTELLARPAISLLWPELADIAQPLSGEYGGRRTILERLPFVAGYGVDLGLVIDVTRRFGRAILAQVDLGTRVHRHRSLDELGPQAVEVLAVLLRRAGIDVAEPAVLRRPHQPPLTVPYAERAPIALTHTDVSAAND